MSITTARLANNVMRTAICLLLLAISIPMMAQTTQKGVVKEYNEKAQKTPLAGVELNVRSAGSAVSDKNGDFSLSFLTLKPGEKVNVRRIEKLGYEVFNKEAIEQWNLNPTNPFIIVMCKSEKFKKIRDNYEKVSSESYARQLKKEEAALAKLKADGKIKEEEYQKQLYELRESYEQQLDNLDNYIDRFSRIDLSELSAVEQEIIELVQQGKIDEAIARYEEQNYVDKYKEESANIVEISNAMDQLDVIKSEKILSRDSLLVKIRRHIDLLSLAGGQESFSKAAKIYMEVADCDTTNVEWMIATSDFLWAKLSDYNRSLVYASRAIDRLNDQDTELRALALSNYGTLMFKLSNYSAAKEYTEKAAAIYTHATNPDIDNLSAIYLKLGHICGVQGEYDDALENYHRSIDIMADSDMTDSISISYGYNGIGEVYRTMGQYEKALDYCNKALEMRLKHCPENKDLISLSYGTIGIIETELGDYQSALTHLQNALDLQIEYYGASHTEVAKTYLTIATIYNDFDEFDKALEYLNMALAIYNDILPEIHDDRAEIYNNMASVYNKIGLHGKAMELYQKTLEIQQTILGENHQNVANTYNNIGTTYSKLNDIPKALEYQFKSLKIFQSILGDDNPKVGDVANNIGVCYSKMGDFEKSLQYFEKTLNINIATYGENHPSTALVLGNIASCYDSSKNYEKSIEYNTRAIDIYKTIYGERHSSLARVYDNISQSYLGLNNLEKAIELSLMALNIRESVYGTEHQDVAISCNNIGQIYSIAKNYALSIEYLTKARDIFTAIRGENDIKAATINMQIGEAYYNLKDYRKAIARFKESCVPIKSYNDNIYNYLNQMTYFSYSELMREDESIREEYDVFMTDKIFVGTVANEQTPAAQRGLAGEYYVIEYNDWNVHSPLNLFDKITAFQGLPKDISLSNGSEIISHHFDDTIGMMFHLAVIDPDKKKSILENYENWKQRNLEY